MNEKRQLLRIKLTEDSLYVQRLGENGARIGKRTNWKIGKRSNLPRELFFKTLGFIHSSIKRCDDRSFSGLHRAVLRALHEAAAAFGCESKSGCDGGDVTWYSDGQPFFAWQIHEEVLNKQQARTLRDSGAALRGVVVVKKSYFRIRMRLTRRYWMLRRGPSQGAGGRHAQRDDTVSVR
jgi:hypothetical protein